MPPKTYRLTILNTAGLPTQAAASFPYKGWIVSASTIFSPAEVMVWQQGMERETSKTFVTVEDAIEYVDAYHKRQIELDSF